MKPRLLTAEEVTFTIEAQEEDIPVRGNASAIDETIDRETEDKILADLEAGNPWAWCHVVVTARWRGFEGRDSLGCCSYASVEDFKSPDGYWPGMKVIALENLNAEIAAAFEKIAPLVTL